MYNFLAQIEGLYWLRFPEYLVYVSLYHAVFCNLFVDFTARKVVSLKIWTTPKPDTLKFVTEMGADAVNWNVFCDWFPLVSASK